MKLFESPPADADVIVSCPDVEPAGIAFDPKAPQRCLAEVERAANSTGRGRIIGVAGAGGGVGTTSVALHLAAALSSNGSACYFEADPNRGARTRLAFDNDVPTVEDLMKKGSIMRAAIPVRGGMRVVLASDDFHERATAVDRCRATFAVTIVDLGANCTDVDLLEQTDLSVLVMVPSLPAATRAAMKLADHDLDWAVVSNRLGPGSEATKRALERRLGRPIGIELPCAPALRDAEDRGDLLISRWSRWWLGIQRLARSLER